MRPSSAHQPSHAGRQASTRPSALTSASATRRRTGRWRARQCRWRGRDEVVERESSSPHPHQRARPRARNSTSTGSPSRAESLLDTIPMMRRAPSTRIRLSTRNMRSVGPLSCGWCVQPRAREFWNRLMPPDWLSRLPPPVASGRCRRVRPLAAFQVVHRPRDPDRETDRR